MLFIVTFHLLPEAFILGGLITAIIGIILGILLVIIVENSIHKKGRKLHYENFNTFRH